MQGVHLLLQDIFVDIPDQIGVWLEHRHGFTT